MINEGSINDLKGGSNVLNMLLNNDGDLGILKPFVWNGKSYYESAKNGKVYAYNADATLRHEEWKLIEDTVGETLRKELPFVQSMRGAGLVKTIPNGFDIGVLQSQKASAGAEVTESMDGLQKSLGDRTVYENDFVPLMITSSDFSFPYRELQMARRMGTGLETQRIRDAVYAVTERIENRHLGNVASTKFAGQDIYGAKNASSTATKNDMTDPSSSGWTPKTTYEEINTMCKTLKTDNLQRPQFKLYYAGAWSEYFNRDYNDNYPNKTLMARILEHSDIESMEEVPNLTDSTFDILIMSKNMDFNRSVDGMAIQTLQWVTDGGLNAHFKIMGIQVPQFRSDYDDHSGCIYGSIS